MRVDYRSACVVLVVMSCSVTRMWLSVVLTLVTLTTARSTLDAVDRGVLERFLLQRARVEAVKRGILQQLGLTEAPRPPPAHNRTGATHRRASAGDQVDERSVMAAYRHTVAQTRRRVASNDFIPARPNDVIDDSVAAGNDVMHVSDTPAARQFYSFKGHAAPGSGCGETGNHRLLFRVDIPEPTSAGIKTVVTSATLKLYVRRRRLSRSQHAGSPLDDIVLVRVYHADHWRHHLGNDTEVTSRAVRVVDDEGTGAWEEFDVTSAVKRHVTQTGVGGVGDKAIGPLRLRVKVIGGGAVMADASQRRFLVFGDDWCRDDIGSVTRELRHRYHPVLNVLTRDRAVTRHRSRRSVLPDVSLSSSSADEPLCTADDVETRCCRRPLWISFREIGWDDWILAPDGYQAYYCYGSCPPGHRTAHNHAAIRELVLTAAPGGGLPVPRPACTATQLGSLALAHYLNGRRVVSIFNDMIVEQCRCA